MILLSFLSLFHVLALSLSPALAPSPSVVHDVSPSLSPSLWTESDYFCGGMQEKESDGT